MLLTEAHIIKKSNPLFEEIDKLTFLSKNLYNYANYLIRQEFIETSKQKEKGEVEHANFLNYHIIRRMIINQIDYCSLPRKVSNQTLMLLDKSWKSFFKSIKDWKKNPSKYTGKPSLPKYKHKTKGRYLLTYELGAISKTKLKENKIKLSGTNIEIPFINNNEKLKQVRVVPLKNNEYKIETIYEKTENKKQLNKEKVCSIDLGVNNLATLTFNEKNRRPILISGGELKSINQYYNKTKSDLQSILSFTSSNKTSNRIKKLTSKRNKKINHFLHVKSKQIIDICLENNIGNLLIGYNKQWKDEINIGKSNNQNFVQIPFFKFIKMLEYKAMLVGIDLILNEESYTSKASFLDLDYIPVRGKDDKSYEFSGYRELRGLYKVREKKIRINSDVNGSYNIMRKVFPKTFVDGIEGFAVIPIRFRPKEQVNKRNK